MGGVVLLTLDRFNSEESVAVYFITPATAAERSEVRARRAELIAIVMS